MIENKRKYTQIIEFYLHNLAFINRQIEYRKRLGQVREPVAIKKLYKPIPFGEVDCISDIINRTISQMYSDEQEYIELRYKRNCTYEVIGGLMNRKRSTVFQLGIDILDAILFNVMLDDKGKRFITSADFRCYCLSSKE